MSVAEPTSTWTVTDWAHALQELKERHNAAILAHWYQGNGIEEVADVVGDSLQLLQAALSLPHPTLVVAATIFIAESVKLLCPEKQVLIPDPLAGCSLAESCPPELFARFRQMYPEAIALVHIQSSAAVKALGDIVITTGTAEHIVRQLPADRTLLLVPDYELGHYLRQRTGRRIVSWFGACVVHTSFSVEILKCWRLQYPDALILCSPQCPPEVQELSDFVGSSSQLLQYAAKHSPSRVILATDHSLSIHLRRILPKAELLLVPAVDNCHCTHCPYMRLNSLPKLYHCLLSPQEFEVHVPVELQSRARQPLERLLGMAATLPQSC